MGGASWHSLTEAEASAATLLGWRRVGTEEPKGRVEGVEGLSGREGPSGSLWLQGCERAVRLRRRRGGGAAAAVSHS